ncbi:MAG: AMP-binding protein, partial [archaeon]|nr:AMP-binding protein [archaeon]
MSSQSQSNIQSNTHSVPLSNPQSLNKDYVEYNKFEDPSSPIGPNYIGPMIHLSINDFSKDIEDRFRDKSTIGNNLEIMKKFKDNDCFGYRKILPDGSFEKKYTYFNYGEVEDMSKRIGRNLHELSNKLIFEEDYEGRHFKLIGIFAKNCVEWAISDIACQLDSICTVTLYATLGQESFKYILDQSGITSMFLSPDLVDTLIKFKNNLNITSIKNIILFDFTVDCKEEHFKQLRDQGFNVYSFKNDFLEKESNVKYEELEISKPDTVLTICYTSGTTGFPKGVMVIQRNMLAALDGSISASGITVNEKSAHLSYLPLAHIMERMVINGHMSVAAKIGFLSGTVKTTLLEDLSLIEPTLLVVVPKVVQTVRNKILEKVNKGPKIIQKIFYKALEVKRRNFYKYGVLTNTFYDLLVFNKVKKPFGRYLKNILCASAPLPSDIALDIKLMLGIPIVEGWGMTELGGSAFASNYYDHKNLSQGGVAKTGKVKLLDVPELGYTKDSIIDGIKQPAGEICIYGPMTFIGYYKNPEETKKTLDDEGYVHTGDVGCITPYGNGIKVIDRVKEIFKLSQGEYIIPNKLEAIYSKSKYVDQFMIYGNSYKNCIIAIMTPNKKNCAEFLGLGKNSDVSEMKKNKELMEEIKKDLLNLANEAKFNSLEKVNYFIFSDKDFTIENGCLNPSMKMVRKKIE